MARSEFEIPLDSIHGKLGKKSKLIFRRKTARDTNGHALYDCVQEIYVVERPRDWKKNPAKGAELEKINRFREACRLTTEQLSDPTTRAVWEQRFAAQQKHPDHDAPFDPRTGHRKIYGQLWAYTRACILRSLQSRPTTCNAK